MPEISPRRKGSRTRAQGQTDARLEKKRQTDRESQRVVRERTKKHIAYLEDLVETLQKSQHDVRLQSMTLQYKQLHEENRRLQDVVTSITRLVKGVGVSGSSEQDPIEQQPKAASESSVHEIKRSDAPISPEITNEFVPIAPREDKHVLIQNPSFQEGQGGQTITLAYESENIVVAVNSLIQQAESLTILPMKPDEDADIAIRAVAHGWVVTEERYELDAVWQLVRQIVEDIFCPCGVIEKLAVLRLLRLKILQQMTLSHQQRLQDMLPLYMHSRPIQNNNMHPRLIDYFVWPELRELLILKGHEASSNQMAAAFSSSLRFRWPFDLCDAWTRNTTTDMYSFSKLFDSNFDNVDSWALTGDFFEMFPQFVGYIPLYETAG